jgi:hypothetical protein
MLKQLFSVEQAQAVGHILALRIDGVRSGIPFAWKSRCELFVDPDPGPGALAGVLTEMQQARELGASAHSGTAIPICPGPGVFGLGTRMSPRPVDPPRGELPHGAAGKEELTRQDPGIQAWETLLDTCTNSRRRIYEDMAASFEISPYKEHSPVAGMKYRAYTHTLMSYAKMFQRTMVDLWGAVDALAKFKRDFPGVPSPPGPQGHTADLLYKDSVAQVQHAKLAVADYTPVLDELPDRQRALAAYDTMMAQWSGLLDMAVSLKCMLWLGLKRERPKPRRR